MRSFQPIEVSIDGEDYRDAIGRHVGNPVWRESIIIVSREDGEIAHLEGIPLDSIISIQDIGLPGGYAGDYQYIGGNYKQYIFRLSNQRI